MPEFYAEHVPSDVDEFTQGYLECAEWLAINLSSDDRADFSLTSEERDKLRGFTRKAIASAKRDCKAFQKENREALALFVEHTGHDMQRAGHYYWLNRNGHGSGFWDCKSCGNAEGDKAIDTLSTSSRYSGGVECEMWRNRLTFT